MKQHLVCDILLHNIWVIDPKLADIGINFIIFVHIPELKSLVCSGSKILTILHNKLGSNAPVISKSSDKYSTFIFSQ